MKFPNNKVSQNYRLTIFFNILPINPRPNHIVRYLVDSFHLNANNLQILMQISAKYRQTIDLLNFIILRPY